MQFIWISFLVWHWDLIYFFTDTEYIHLLNIYNIYIFKSLNYATWYQVPDIHRSIYRESILFICLFIYLYVTAATAKSLQLCPTLCDPIDGSLPGSLILGILQARTVEWVAISFSNAWKWKVKVKSLSRVRLCATPWTAAHQAPPSMGFSR